MDLFELDDLIYDLGIDPTVDQLELLYKAFEKDFVTNTLIVDGSHVKIILENSKVLGFKNYPETFVHLITRKSSGGKRVFDKFRANKIHWVKCILENRDNDYVLYFEYPDEDGNLRFYFWFREKGFLVIMKKIAPDFLIVTSFCIDNKKNDLYYEKRYHWYLNNRA